MAVRRPPREHAKLSQDVDKFIDEGGSIPTRETVAGKDVRFSLTIPYKICQKLDKMRLDEPLKTSRHQWVLQAIIQRLENGS